MGSVFEKITKPIKEITEEIGEATGSVLGVEKEAPPPTPSAQAPNADDQRRAAEEKIKAQKMQEVADKKLGLQSTILGGSEGDSSVLMKKKLLGE